ncbi:cation-translocating P-type ATPase [Mycoplasmopsis lipofaciens]|uniref:cation-translocating P-type ATPase n=1 Tax=Mycoplasmopsis lipofaciens TaxID=114884 RepID=UPI00047F8B9B|nr:cation-translocating P-type ATPase [Mycoplasmopsis lipofaciens]
MNNEKLKKGLKKEEVLQKLNQYGENTLLKKKKLNPFIAFLKQFMDPMVILLIIAALISLSLAIYEHLQNNNSLKELIVSYVEPGIIMIVIILNSMLGAYQEIKSDQAVRALEKINQVNTTVIRDNKVEIVPANLIVPGDIIILASGDTINADCKIIESNNLEVIESSLTGESIPVKKKEDFDKKVDKILANNSHMVYSGTYVTNGRAICLVEKTGSNTQIGIINSMIQNENKNITPLQFKLNKLGKWFGYSGIILLFISFIMQILMNNISTGIWNNPDIYTESLVTGISLAVAAIPEGLITFTTVILFIGVKKLSKQNGLVKNLLAVETLGSASIICTDKTGTLTENKMRVVDSYICSKQTFINKQNENSFLELAKYFTLCNDGFITYNKKQNEFKEVGDPTETGILRWSYSFNLTKENLINKYPILTSLPFDSNRKMSSVLIKVENNYEIITKGAPDVIIEKCINIDKQEIKKINEEWAKKSYRVLAIAKKNHAIETLDFKDENDLELIGLVAMIDPPRANVAQSIAEAKLAGIKTVMITGDHIVTAKAIASKLDIYQNGDLCINGEELKKMSDEELKNKVSSISVYARVNPEDKLRIIKAWQAHEKVVAMTGDGVNDAPALKASDIGCAMGITGTDVSKQAADLILVDDNFNTIVNSVKNGRLIYDKIKTVILNLLISSLSEVLIMLIGMIAFFFAYKKYYINGFYIFAASQLLWINLLTHGLPAIALGFVDSNKNVMNRKPFEKKESIFARGMGMNLIIQSCILSLLSLISYVLGAEYAIQNNLDVASVASTTAFVTLGVAASINSINLMSEKSIFTASFKKYWLVWLSASFSLVATLIIVFIPQLAKMFRMSTNYYNNVNLIAMSIPISFGLIAYNEIYKLINLIRRKNKN